MDLGLRGRVALVAGASSGIGKAIAEVFAEEGCLVAVLSRSEARLKSAVDDIGSKSGSKVLPVVCDVTDKDEIKKAVEQVAAKLGEIDILVCNAGGPPSGTFEKFKDEHWDLAYELNLKSTIRLCMLVLPGMKKRKWGRIINVTSVAAMQPMDNLILSNTVRAGVHGFTKTLSNEVASSGVTVNCICPGFTDTERLQELADQLSKGTGSSPEDVRANWYKNIPAQRLAEPREMGYLAAFLASEQAGYLTGVALNLDGGLVKSI
jgi:3-oxoacyl-[acyl-carrier protein] reductase